MGGWGQESLDGGVQEGANTGVSRCTPCGNLLGIGHEAKDKDKDKEKGFSEQQHGIQSGQGRSKGGHTGCDIGRAAAEPSTSNATPGLLKHSKLLSTTSSLCLVYLMEAPLNHLCILQINLNKSKKGHLDLINKLLDRAWDMILVQELHILWNRFRAPNNFTTIYPQEHYTANP